MDREQVLLSVVVSGSGSAEAFGRSVLAARRACRNAESVEVFCLVDGDPVTERRLLESDDRFLVIPAAKLTQWDRMLRGRFVQFVRPGQELNPAWFRIALLAFREGRVGAVRGSVQPQRDGGHDDAPGGWLVPRSLLNRLPEGTRPFGGSFQEALLTSVEVAGLRPAELEIPMVFEARRGLCRSCRSAYLRGRSAALSAVGPGQACLFSPVARPVRWALLWTLLAATACVFPTSAGLLAGAYLLQVVSAFRAGPLGIGWRSRCAASALAPFEVFPEAAGVLTGLLALWRSAGRAHLAPAAQASLRDLRSPRRSNADRARHGYLHDGVSLS